MLETEKKTKKNVNELWQFRFALSDKGFSQVETKRGFRCCENAAVLLFFYSDVYFYFFTFWNLKSEYFKEISAKFYLVQPLLLLFDSIKKDYPTKSKKKPWK